jgi:hypothetical protein
VSGSHHLVPCWATANMNMNGWDRTISVDLGGPLFANAGGAKQSISRLPLAEGYSTTYRNYDVQKQRVKLTQLKVSGVEKVTVPAGAFDAYIVEVSSADGGPDQETLWVDRDSHQAVKESAVLPSMGGAVSRLDSRLLVEPFGVTPSEARVTMPLVFGQRKFPNSPKPLKTPFASTLQLSIARLESAGRANSCAPSPCSPASPEEKHRSIRPW